MKQKITTSFYLDILLIGFLIFATILLNLVMIRDGLNGMTDMKWHVTWLQHFFQQLSEGILYPRWLAGTNYGYGSPTFVFYPPLVYYIGSLFKFIGFSTENTITLLFSLALFLSGLNFYLLGFKTWGKLPSFVGALFYMSTPYLAFDIYYRSGLASIFIQAWIPLLLLSTQKTLANPKFSFSLAISWFLIALTHTPSLLLCSIVYFLYLILLLPQKGWKNIFNLLVVTFCGWGMASIYLVPAILEKSFVNISSLKNVHGGFRDALIGTSLPLFPLDFTNLLNIPSVFLQQFLAVIVFFAIAISKTDRFIKRSAFLWLIVALITAFLMTNLSQFIWETSEVLQMVQFPWRFLQFFSAIGAIMCSLALTNITQNKLIKKSIILIFVIVILMFNFRYWYKLSRQFITLNYSGKGNTEHLNHIRTILNSPDRDNLRDVPEYRPLLDNVAANPPQPSLQQPKLSILKGKASIELRKWRTYWREFIVNNSTKSTIRIRTYYYPAWQLYIDDRLSVINKHTDGTIVFELQPGRHRVKLIYQKTQAFSIGILFSVLSLIFLVIYQNILLNITKITYSKLALFDK